MDYSPPPEIIPRAVDFHFARTSDGSTLSRLVHAWVLARSDRHRSWSLFTQALASDLAKIQGGTTREGVHLGAKAGTVDLILRCYSGLEIRDDVLRLHPSLPPELPKAAFKIVSRGQRISVELTRAHVSLLPPAHSTDSITICVEDQMSVLAPGDEHIVALAAEAPIGHSDGKSRRAPANATR